MTKKKLIKTPLPFRLSFSLPDLIFLVEKKSVRVTVLWKDEKKKKQWLTSSWKTITFMRKHVRVTASRHHGEIKFWVSLLFFPFSHRRSLQWRLWKDGVASNTRQQTLFSVRTNLVSPISKTLLHADFCRGAYKWVYVYVHFKMFVQPSDH